jgi:uncharacterized membrane protein YraQ (UPF0718 family)/copper chaperone CopZ
MISSVFDILMELAPWLLLGALVAGVLHVALPKDFVQRTMSGKRGVVRAVLIGIPLPLCSCGVIPAGIGLRKDGASKGASVGFMIATPQTGVDSVLVSGALLGWPFALFKVLSALLMGLVGGGLVDRLVPAESTVSVASPVKSSSRAAWPRELLIHSVDLLRMIWGWLLIGIIVSAALSHYLPTSALSSWLPGSALGSLLFALLLSLPLYVCATASVPIAAALVAGGLPLGAALVFLIAGPATNLATMGAVHRSFGGRALAIYLSTLIVGSVGCGLAFDFLLSGSAVVAPAHEHGEVGWRVLPALVLSTLLGWFAFEEIKVKLSAWRNRRPQQRPASLEVRVEGMTCQGCARRLQSRLCEVPGVESATVNLEEKRAVLYGQVQAASVHSAVEKAGFRPV